MEKFENTNTNPSDKDSKLAAIIEDFNKLSVDEAFRQKHIVFEVNECFEKTKINLFDNFISFYTKAYDTDLEDQSKIKQKLNDAIYAVRFDPALFLLRDSMAGYLVEYKTLCFPDMKSYKNPEIYTHEIIHSLGSIHQRADGSRIDDYEIYNAFNEGITEKMTTEMTGKRKEQYSPYVKCAQIIDAIAGYKVNYAFQEYDLSIIKEGYDKQINEGSFDDLIFRMHGIESTLKSINKYGYEAMDFEEKNDVNSVGFGQKYNAIKKILSEDDKIRLSGDKEKYLLQADQTDKELEKFENEVVNYVIAKEYTLKYDNGENINLICERMADTIDKHLEILINKSDTNEKKMDIMQKFCNIQAAFNFSENKIKVLERGIVTNMVKLYKKMTNMESAENIDVYAKLEIQHSLKWLANAEVDSQANAD